MTLNNILIFQPALPSYRLDFFRRLSTRYDDNMRVYFSPQDMGALTEAQDGTEWSEPIGPMLYPFPGVEWQVGAMSIPIRKGDLVVICGAPRTLTTLLVLLKAKIKGARTIWWGQYWSASSLAHRHRLRMKLTHLADALLFYTDAEVARFHNDGWTHSGPVGALNNGIDLTEVRRLRLPYITADRGPNLLFIGRLTDKAQLGLMVTALANPAMADVHLHVIGGGAKEAELRAQAQALGVAQQITWHGGTTDEARIAEVANQCAVFVYPGQVGLSLIHAMGYGLPCVVHGNRMHQMPEMAAFEDNGTGSVFDEGSSASLAQSVSELLAAPSARIDMSFRCTEITRTDYTTERMAERFAAFVQSMPETRGKL